jgi:hypothetical protein
MTCLLKLVLRILLYLFPVGAIWAQMNPVAQYPHEMLFIEWQNTSIEYYKAPLDAALASSGLCYPFLESCAVSLSETEWIPLASVPLAVVDSDAQWMTPINKVDINGGLPAECAHADGTIGACVNVYEAPRPEKKLKTRTITFQQPSPVIPGVTVSFASQGPQALKAMTGKLVPHMQIIKANVCAPSTGIANVGKIISLANKMGIADIDKDIAASMVTQTVDRGWRHLFMVIATETSGIAASIFVPGIVAAPKAVSTGLLGGHIFLDHAPVLIAPGAPTPAPLLNSLLDASANVAFSGPSCQKVLFAADYTGAKSRIVTGPLPLE